MPSKRKLHKLAARDEEPFDAAGAISTAPRDLQEWKLLDKSEKQLMARTPGKSRTPSPCPRLGYQRPGPNGPLHRTCFERQRLVRDSPPPATPKSNDRVQRTIPRDTSPKGGDNLPVLSKRKNITNLASLLAHESPHATEPEDTENTARESYGLPAQHEVVPVASQRPREQGDERPLTGGEDHLHDLRNTREGRYAREWERSICVWSTGNRTAK